MRLLPYGDDAVFVDLELGDDLHRIRRTHAVARALKTGLPSSSDIVLGEAAIVVVGERDEERIEALVRDALPAALPPLEEAPLHIVPTIYDGPDLAEVAEETGLSPDEVVRLHTSREYLVEVVGFLPGFAYMGPVDPKLVLPRRSSPRPRIPKGSVAIAGRQTGIYPFSSPGGWNLIGRAKGVEPFDPSREPPLLFAPGDRVRFERVHGD